MFKVFVSYAHEDNTKNSCEAVYEIFTKLDSLVKSMKNLELWNDGKIPIGEKWHETIQKALEDANVAILLLSKKFFKSEYIKEHEISKIFEAWKDGSKILFPIIINDVEDVKKEAFLNVYSVFPNNSSTNKLESICENYSSNIDSKIDEAIKKLEQYIDKGIKPPFPFIYSKSDFKSLPKPSQSKLIGRDENIKEINNFLNLDNSESRKNKFYAIIADGGYGKSSIIYNVTKKLEADKLKIENSQYERAFGWSFYNQGQHTTYNSSDEFFDNALEFFAFDNVFKRISENAYEPEENLLYNLSHEEKVILDFIKEHKIIDDNSNNTKSSIEIFRNIEKSLPEKNLKNEILVFLIKQYNTLIVLDGLETLQTTIIQGANENLGGELSDNKLRTFLDKIKGYNSTKETKIIFTSRQTIREIDEDQNKKLDKLSAKYSLELFNKVVENSNVLEDKKDIEDLVNNKLQKIPLIIVLYASYIKNHYSNHIWDGLGVELNETYTEQAERILEHNVKKLNGQKEFYIEFLQIVSLFDRPMHINEFEYLINIHKANLSIRNQEKSDLNGMYNKLAEISLIQKDEQNRYFDMHPIVKEYFNKEFSKPDKIKEYNNLHENLSNYFKEQADNETEEKNKILLYFRSAYHLTKAQKYNEAWNMYDKYISKGSEFFSLRQLGMVTSNLSLFSRFFDKDWSLKVSETMNNEKLMSLLRATSHHLMTIGSTYMIKVTELEYEKKKEIYDTDNTKFQNYYDALAGLYDVYYFNGDLDKASKLTSKTNNIKDKFYDLILTSRYLNIEINKSSGYKGILSEYKKLLTKKKTYLDSIADSDLEEHYKKYNKSYYQKEKMLTLENFKNELEITDNIDEDIFKNNYDKFFDDEIDIEVFFKNIGIGYKDEYKSKLKTSKDFFPKIKDKKFLTKKKNIKLTIKNEIYYNKPHVIWEDRMDSYFLDLIISGKDKDLGLNVKDIEERVKHRLTYHKKAERIGYIALSYINLAKIAFIIENDNFKKQINEAINEAKKSGKKDFIFEALTTKGLLLKKNGEIDANLNEEMSSYRYISKHISCEIDYNYIVNDMKEFKSLMEKHKFQKLYV